VNEVFYFPTVANNSRLLLENERKEAGYKSRGKKGHSLTEKRRKIVEYHVEVENIMEGTEKRHGEI